MSESYELGKAGEEAAAMYLMNRGYVILHRNWRRGKLELDITAMKDRLLVIVEVKTRPKETLTEPEEAVNEKKIRHIVLATDAYIKALDIEVSDVRFDIIGVTGRPGDFTIRHIEDAFDAPLW